MSYLPYNKCKGRVFRKLPKLRRLIITNKKSIICNDILSDKNKIRFVSQIFRWFRKDNKYYKINYFLSKKVYISNGDIIYLSVKIHKAGLKKLLLKIGHILKDYKKLKKRSYALNFIFFFTNIEEKTKLLTLDINVKSYDLFNIFVTTNSFYFNEFYYMINILNKNKINIED